MNLLLSMVLGILQIHYRYGGGPTQIHLMVKQGIMPRVSVIIKPAGVSINSLNQGCTKHMFGNLNIHTPI